jgi:hypothetical protein
VVIGSLQRRADLAGDHFESVERNVVRLRLSGRLGVEAGIVEARLHLASFDRDDLAGHAAL